MGLQKCGGCLSCLLIPLAVWSIVINILLYFPDGKSLYASNNDLTNYVWYFEGICFSGIMMLMLAALLIILDQDSFHTCCQNESCTKTYRRFISVVLALLGISFSGYSLIISALGLVQGPYCRTPAGWEYPFKDTAGSYLMDPTVWSQCSEPAYIVEWNIILFSILITLSGLQILICCLKVIAELKRILCGTYPVFVQPALI
ncbi:transmembrane 4 L6 family member 18 [Varanus komodoensis]|uniref:Transmembrane 4 L six family member 18 n=1 Tax=Varanus komodoensis TaxID=61221 RepID=A0A8D2LQV2_VARKO|nr:transmembrane 4 L6 family member 18 [Varanus komodoensis]